MRRKSFEISETEKVKTSGLRRKSLTKKVLGTKLDNSVAAKRDALAVKQQPCDSVNTETSGLKKDGEVARSADGSRLKAMIKLRITKQQRVL